MRIARWATGLMAVVALLLFSLSPVAAAGTAPALPAAGSSLATWQTWAAQETAWAQGQDWAQSFAHAAPSGCTTVSTGVTMFTTTGSDNAPAGVTFGLGSFMYQCPAGVSSAYSQRGTSRGGGQALRA